jgi:hypothetical protein
VTSKEYWAMTKWELLFIDGFFNIRYILDCHQTVEHFPNDFWEALSWGWMCEYIFPYDDPYNLTISPERKLRLAQELPTFYVSPEAYDKLVEAINSPPKPSQGLIDLMNRPSPWEE